VADVKLSPVELRQRRIMAAWLFWACAMVFGMVVLGGLTRLTHSGLSMVDWHPVTGWLPPMSQVEWQALFAKYQEFPQYKKLNVGMTVEEFKNIFWLEFIHRLWGRLLGVVFGVPLVIFMVKGWVKGALTWKLLLALVLGGLQGVLGWYMVKSGLIDRPDVSQYRLAAHLGAALVIYGYLWWLILELLVAVDPSKAVQSTRPLLRGGNILLGMIALTIVSGAFVAGLDAGFAYNTFPLMGGRLIPDGLFELTPIYLNFFENITMVQFNHRVLAIAVLVVSISVWALRRRRGMSGRLAVASHVVLGAVCLQVVLGVSTLLLMIPVGLASLHQANAFVLFGAIVWLVFEIRRR
jgi:cytochrome c oxidase assembly protein subunit 15